MRSQAKALLLRRARAILADAPHKSHRALISRRTRASVQRPDRVFARPSSSGSPTAAAATEFSNSSPAAGSLPPPEEPAPEVPAADAPVEESRKTRRPRTTKESEPPPPLPTGLNVLWTPDADGSEADINALPPPEILDEVITNLRVALHPQTQHKAAFATADGPPTEPTIALYCPVEGGDYIVDETVREMARQTGSEVVVLDSVQLAGGEWGAFGKAASVLQFSQNPLHFPSSPPASPRLSRRQLPMEDDDEPDFAQMMSPSAVAVHVLTPSSARPARSVVTPRSASMAKAKTFFEGLIDTPTPSADSSENSTPLRKPRIIYVRDFPTLAPSSSQWWPALLAAVRSRRQGPQPRSNSPVWNPTTVVFGVTPPLAGPSSNTPVPAGTRSVLVSRPGSMPPGGIASLNPRGGRLGWGEDEVADAARERRLREKLQRWQLGDRALADDIPVLEDPGMSEGDGSPANGGSDGRMMVLGGGSGGPGAGMLGLPAMLSQAFGVPRLAGGAAANGSSGSFYRTTVLVPHHRSPTREKACRIARRREINELTLRMAVGAIGGTVGPMEPPVNLSMPEEVPVKSVEPASSGDKASTEDAAAESDTTTVEERVWAEWGKRVEPWPIVRQVADRAMGISMAEGVAGGTARAVLGPTHVEWDAVFRAWEARRAAREARKEHAKSLATTSTRVRGEEEEEELDIPEQDDIIDQVRRDPDLDQHEQRLLSCIVDPATMPTSFDQVHLPAPTIDAVRTIVSLPILFPEAFQHGILKEHSMTGCLLFGPPGTGKTLLARALTKEAGVRMLQIAPSDVMDMYVGEGEKLVKSVFSLARRLAPCVVFIDELDALFGARASGRESGGAIAHRGVLTEFMQEMDGLRSSKDDNVIVIGATNRPFDLDDAVLRRLPRRLLVDLPGEKEREEILKILLRGETLAPDVDLHTLARKTESFSGSDLKHLCVSAALDSVKEGISVPWAQTPSQPPSEQISSEPSMSSPSAANGEIEAYASNNTCDTAAPSIEPEASGPPAASPADIEVPPPRTIRARNFDKALQEITPSASESLGTLADLRKWNEEFGEGRKDKKVQVWGKGKFGFSIRPAQETVEGSVRSD